MEALVNMKSNSTNINNLTIFAYMYFLLRIKDIFLTLIPFICLLLKIFNFNMYFVETREKINIIYNKVSNDFALKYDEDKKPKGIILHKSFIPKYICFTNEYKYDGIYIFTCDKVFQDLIKDKKKYGIINLEKIKKSNKIEKIKKHKKIKYLMKRGFYGNIHFRDREVEINNDSFNIIQENLYQNIMNFYNKNNFAKIFISGNIGKGKTYFSYLLAKYLNCYLCDSFNPTEPSSTLDNLYTSVDHSYKEPLIILIDEVDIIFKKITQKEPIFHKKFPIMIKNKIDWNNFLDKIQYGLYKNIILILCSNMEKEEIDKKYDKSFLREGRINIFSKF